jgi:hypothetical protein
MLAEIAKSCSSQKEMAGFQVVELVDILPIPLLIHVQSKDDIQSEYSSTAKHFVKTLRYQ